MKSSEMDYYQILDGKTEKNVQLDPRITEISKAKCY